MNNLNKVLFEKIYHKRHRFLTIASWLISNGSFLVLFFLSFILFLIILKQNFEFTLKIFLNSFLAVALVKLVVDKLIKKYYYKPRPFVFYESIEGIGKKEKNSTLPSGHVTMVTAIVFTIIFYSPAVIWLILAIPLVMWSRIYNGMHWPLDVLVGFFLGAFIANVSFVLINFLF